MKPRNPENDPAVPEDRPKPSVDEASDAVDVSRIHLEIVKREMKEPNEGFEPTPWWVWTASAVLLFIMGFYLGRYGGSFSPTPHEVEGLRVPVSSATAPEVRGDIVFGGVCQPCHQPNGLGIAGQYPPLAGSEWLLTDTRTPIRIVLRGLHGPITVKGNPFDNRMPPFFDKLTNAEIAAALSHARRSWGNTGGEISTALVDTLRKETEGRPPWTAAELEGMRRSSKQ